MESDNPILNSKYEELELLCSIEEEGALDYSKIIKSRRIFAQDILIILVKQGTQQTIFDINESAGEFRSHPINLIRKEVGVWREQMQI